MAAESATPTPTPTPTTAPEDLGDELFTVAMTTNDTEGQPVEFTLTGYVSDGTDPDYEATCEETTPSTQFVVVDVVAVPAGRTLESPFYLFADNYFHPNLAEGDVERTSEGYNLDDLDAYAAECAGDLTLSQSGHTRVTVGCTKSVDVFPAWSYGRFGFLSEDKVFDNCETQLTELGEQPVTAGVTGWDEPWQTATRCSVGTYITH